jgi:6-phosphofructokinase 1
VNASDLSFAIRRLGDCQYDSPIALSDRADDCIANYVTDDQRVVYRVDVDGDTRDASLSDLGLFEKAGPRQRIYFDPGTVHAAILTAGGLCPGLNDVIRSIVMTLWYRYGVRRITGLRFGYRGLYDDDEQLRVPLNPEFVRDIHRTGGTVLGSSRGGGERTLDMAKACVGRSINLLFCIGGDGTQKGALTLAHELTRVGTPCAVVGIPKTIDNDLSFVERSFGFDTAVSEAVLAVAAAHTEARAAVDGIGLVKVMGRQSGFIAVHTALAQNDVNFVLIPEVPFDLEGDNGLLCHLDQRLRARHHAVILVAEGAGQSLLEATHQTDASGNPKLADIGPFLCDRIRAYFKGLRREVNVKYIDPSYIIRSAPTIANDSIYCQRLGANAVHAAMAGRTECLVGLVNGRFVHVPMPLAAGKRNFVDPESALWRDVVEATGQPPLMCNGT